MMTQEPAKKPPSITLPLVEVKVDDTKLYALVDTVVSKMFTSSEVAKGLGH